MTALSGTSRASEPCDQSRISTVLSMRRPGEHGRAMPAGRWLSHCDGAVALLDGAACVFVQSRIPDMPRVVCGVPIALERAFAHGRTKEKNLPVPPGDAPQPSGAAARGARGVRQLRRVEAATPRVQALRLLPRARGDCGRQGAARRCPGLSPVRVGLQVCR